MRPASFALILIVVLIGVWSTSLVVQAAVDNGIGDPNDPNDDNSCYTGGVWEGKCNSDWAWNAGWYLNRALNGELTCAQVPLEYRSACLTHFPERESVPGVAGELEPTPMPL